MRKRIYVSPNLGIPESFNVEINGEKNVLTLAYFSGQDWQYNTIGNKSGHTFRNKLKENTTLFTSGNKYKILNRIPL